jgi:hypothetical protein
MGPMFPSITLTDSDEKTDLIMKVAGEKTFTNTTGELVERGLAMTSKGRIVKVWKANPSIPIFRQYYCHGFALNTYRRFGYSVCSGVSIVRALMDDYVLIDVVGQTVSDALAQLKAGDIVSFEELSEKIIHTAQFYCIDAEPNDPLKVLKLRDVILSTKNGLNADCIESLETTFNTYPTTQRIKFWRDKLACFDATMHS